MSKEIIIAVLNFERELVQTGPLFTVREKNKTLYTIQTTSAAMALEIFNKGNEYERIKKECCEESPCKESSSKESPCEETCKEVTEKSPV